MLRQSSAAAWIAPNITGFVVPSMAAFAAEYLENVLGDESAIVAAIIDDDLDRFLTLVAGETKIKAVRGNCHKACFLVQAYTTEPGSQTNKRECLSDAVDGRLVLNRRNSQAQYRARPRLE